MVYFARKNNSRELNVKASKGLLIKIHRGIYVDDLKNIDTSMPLILDYLGIKGIPFYRTSLEYHQNFFPSKTIYIISSTINKKISLADGYFTIEVLKNNNFAKWKNLSSNTRYMNENLLFLDDLSSIAINLFGSKIFSKRANKELALDEVNKTIVRRYQTMQFSEQFFILFNNHIRLNNLENIDIRKKHKEYMLNNNSGADERRVLAFKALYEQLLVSEAPAESHQDDKMFFYESYFSNYIEGTEFEISEARKIVYNPKHRYERHRDGYDIKNTYKIIKDMHKKPIYFNDFDSFCNSLKKVHFELMYHRKDSIRVGEFKTKVNRSGEVYFVQPSRVLNTLKVAFDYYMSLEKPIHKAIYIHTILSEIHPFDDGNGRVARLMMNNELSKYALMRIIIPTVFRDDYIIGLKEFSNRANPKVVINSLFKALKITNTIEWKKSEVEVEEYIRNNSGFEKSSSGIWGVKPNANQIIEDNEILKIL
jgi:hypothetical protein